MKLKCIIVDDEPIARKVIEEFITDLDFLELCGKAENPVKANNLLNQHTIDLIFLDIQMPKMNGIDFLKSSKKLPMVIITTAFPEYALEGFELDVMDYLVKPIAFERFLKACNKAKEFYDLKNNKLQTDKSQEFFFVKCNSKFEKIVFDELLFVQALNNYVLLHTKDKRLVTYLTFKGIEEILPLNQFIRVHKSFIVSISKIENLDGEEIKIGNYNIPISRSLKDAAVDRIINNRLVKR